MDEKNQNSDVLFLALTRPQTKLGVSVECLIYNMMITAMVVNLTSNPLMFFFAIPIHLCFAVICARDPKFFSYITKQMANQMFFAGGSLKKIAKVRGFIR